MSTAASSFTSENPVCTRVRRRTRLDVTIVLFSALAAVIGCSAPPVPHEIESGERSYCLSCHEKGLHGAPKTTHPNKGACLTCHEPEGTASTHDGGSQ